MKYLSLILYTPVILILIRVALGKESEFLVIENGKGSEPSSVEISIELWLPYLYYCSSYPLNS